MQRFCLKCVLWLCVETSTRCTTVFMSRLLCSISHIFHSVICAANCSSLRHPVGLFAKNPHKNEMHIIEILYRMLRIAEMEMILQLLTQKRTHFASDPVNQIARNFRREVHQLFFDLSCSLDFFGNCVVKHSILKSSPLWFHKEHSIS